MKGMESNRALRLAEQQAEYELKVDVAKLQYASDEKEFGELIDAVVQKSQLKRYSDLATESERRVFSQILSAVGPAARVWMEGVLRDMELDLSTEDGQDQLIEFTNQFVDQQMAMYAAKAGLAVPGGGGGGKYVVREKKG